MTKQKPKVPPSNIPILGQQVNKIQVQEVVNTIMAQLKPTLDIILENIDGLERRVNVVEEVKQVFPAKVEVVIKKEGVEGWRSNLEKRLDKLERPGK